MHGRLRNVLSWRGAAQVPTFQYLVHLLLNPCQEFPSHSQQTFPHIFSTFDMDKLGKICQLRSKEPF